MRVHRDRTIGCHDGLRPALHAGIAAASHRQPDGSDEQVRPADRALSDDGAANPGDDRDRVGPAPCCVAARAVDLPDDPADKPLRPVTSWPGPRGSTYLGVHELSSPHAGSWEPQLVQAGIPGRSRDRRWTRVSASLHVRLVRMPVGNTQPVEARPFDQHQQEARQRRTSDNSGTALVRVIRLRSGRGVSGRCAAPRNTPPAPCGRAGSTDPLRGAMPSPDGTRIPGRAEICGWPRTRQYSVP